LLESVIWHESCPRLGVAQKIQIEGTAPGRLSPAGVDGRSFFSKLASFVVILELVGSWALAQDKQPTTGAVQGIVFITDPDGGRSIVPGAKISLDGPAHFEGKSSTDGKFAITGVAPGAYEVTAKAP